ASSHSGQATLRVAVGLSRSFSATIITLTPHLQRQVDTIVITVPQILRGGHRTSKHFPKHQCPAARTNSTVKAYLVQRQRSSDMPLIEEKTNVEEISHAETLTNSLYRSRRR